jgi:hypothetical protein
MPRMKPQGLVDLSFILTTAGLRDRDNATICGVAVQTIRRWRRRYQRQRLPRGQTHTCVPCPRCEDGRFDDHAYALLLGWYLGDGHIAHQHDGVYSLAICNDLVYPGLNAEIAAAMTGVKPGGRVHTRRLPGAMEIKLTWKHWPCLFPQHGPGMKHTRPIILQPWQREIVEQHPGRFLRGLSIRMAAGSPTGPSARWADNESGTSIHAISSRMRRPTSSGCAPGHSTFSASLGGRPTRGTSQSPAGLPSRRSMATSARSTEAPGPGPRLGSRGAVIHQHGRQTLEVAGRLVAVSPAGG